MNTTAIIHTAIAADATATYQGEIAALHYWPPSKRREVLIAMREELIEQMMAVLELGAELAQIDCEAAAEAVEVSAELEEAIKTAQAVGCAVVTGVAALALELERLVPGCCRQQGYLYISTVQLDGGELRLVRRSGSYRGALSWRAA